MRLDKYLAEHGFSSRTKAARALGREDEASFYGAWAEEIREAFQKTYLLPGGDNPCRTQTSYVLALAFDLVPEADRAHAFRLLERLGTDPQVYYISRREWVRREGDNYLEHEKTGEATKQG